jgi:hypothetical protein
MNKRIEKSLFDDDIKLQSHIYDVYTDLHKIYSKYRTPELKDSEFSKEDYALIQSLQERAQSIINSSPNPKEFNKRGHALPFDMCWRKGPDKVHTKQNLIDIAGIVAELNKIYDHLEFIWSFHRSYQYEDLSFAEVEYLKIMDYFEIIYNYITQGHDIFKVDWEGIYLDIPSDLKWKIPAKFRQVVDKISLN